MVGRTLSIGPANPNLNGRLAKIEEMQKGLAPKIKAGVTLKQAQAVILEAGQKAGLSIAQDLPLMTGIGFDLSEYPSDGEDRIETNSVLQVALAVDSKDFTAMCIDMLQVTPGGGIWLDGA